MDTNTYQKLRIAGIDAFKNEQFNQAIDCFLQVIDLTPKDLAVNSLLGDAYMKVDQKDSACRFYSRALAINPTNTSMLIRYSETLLRGAHYIDALKNIHKCLQPQRYIEIGVCRGVSFRLAAVETVAIGIDPEPQLNLGDLPINHQVITVTSDCYFKASRILQDFQGLPFDMAFLDGMHLFEYALRDFINLEKHSGSNSVVFVHDLYPMNAPTADRERLADFWSGDVWKLVLCLQEYRPDLDLSVLPCPPTGLGVISGLNKNSTVLIDNYDQILDAYIDLPFNVIESDREAKLCLASIDNHWLTGL